MAIQDDTTHESTSAPKTTAQAPQRPVQKSFHTGSLFAAPISRSVNSKAYDKLKTGLEEAYKGADPDVEIVLLDLDKSNEPALAFSSIIVAMRSKQVPQYAAYHVLTLAGTGDKLAPHYDTIGSQQVEVIHVPSEAIDDVLLQKAKNKVAQAFQRAEPLFCDATVIPADFNIEDVDAVHQVALNSGLACSTELHTRTKDFADMNLSAMAHDTSLGVNITFNRTQVADIVGNPMRSDIQVSFSSKRNNNQRNGSVNSGDRELKLYEASGFTDMVWAPLANGNALGQWNTNVAQPTQKYVARLIITSLRSEFSYTPASILLALACAQVVRDDNNWIQSFRPLAVQGVDMTDIGALNIEANLMNDPSGIGARIDTKEDKFKLPDLGKLAAALVQPGMLISLDCPEYGGESWYTSMFISGSRGNPGAYAAIYDSAMQLTNGEFAKHFPNGSQMFINTNNRIHMGTYVNNRGEKRDIRDFDHIAVANLIGERDRDVLRGWSDTFLREDYPLAQRLFARKRIISALSGETAVFTGFAERVTFSRGFIEALTAGVLATGLPVNVTTPLSNSDFNDQRAVAKFAGAGLVSPGSTFQNRGNYGAYQNAGVYNNSGAHRW